MSAAPSVPPDPEHRLGSFFRGNYVWCGAMNLAWNELNEKILHGKLRLATSDAAALATVDALNGSTFGAGDLDEGSRYVAAGYGQQTVERINREVRAKFPARTLPDLAARLQPQDIVAYAFVLKQVEYPVQFSRQPVTFGTTLVEGFATTERDQRETVRIVKYWSNDRFILSLRLKEAGDELLLAKGFAMENPREVAAAVDAHAAARAPAMGEDDSFAMPALHLEHTRSYDELIGDERRGPFLANEGFTEYYIGKMLEQIKFDLDHRGARAEAAATIVVAARMMPRDAKRLVLDKPFWVVLRRSGSRNPYLLIGVSTPDLMAKSAAASGR